MSCPWNELWPSFWMQLTGTKFVDIDLSEEWSEYDEKAAESVGILNMQHRFVVTK